MNFMALVVLPIGLTVGAVAWTVFRKGGFGSLVLSMVLAVVGGLVGFFGAQAVFTEAGPAVAGVGAVMGALVAGALETVVRWRSPRSIDDPHARQAGGAPIDDPPVRDVVAGRREDQAHRAPV